MLMLAFHSDSLLEHLNNYHRLNINIVKSQYAHFITKNKPLWLKHEAKKCQKLKFIDGHLLPPKVSQSG